MKSMKIAMSLLLLTATVTGRAVTAEPGLKYDSGNGWYEISSIKDWNTLAAFVADGNTCQGKVFKMLNDIGTEQDPVTTMMGCQLTSAKNSRKRFDGTFDGGNHTLTVSLSSVSINPNYTAPFAYVSRVTIKNLHVTGTISSSGQFAAGLIGSSGNGKGDGYCTVENCRVSVSVVSNYRTTSGKNANHGGIIGITEGDATITDTWFDGAFLAGDLGDGKEGDFIHSGGFIGLTKEMVCLKNCLFNPLKCWGDNSESVTFYHISDTSKEHLDATSEKFYYVAPYGGEQGTKVVPSLEIDEDGSAVLAPDGNTYYIVKSVRRVHVTARAAKLCGQPKYWATFYHPTLSFETNAKVLTMRDDGGLSVVGNGDVIPAACPVILMAPSDDIILIRTDKTATPKTGNVMNGTFEEIANPAGGETEVFVLGVVDDGELGWVSYTGEKLPAYIAYRVESVGK